MAWQSKELTAFYNAYHAWLLAGAPQYRPFDRGVGLCSNSDKRSEHSLRREMKKQFLQAGLDDLYPFYPAGDDRSYNEEILSDTCHLNPVRIAWVKDHLS